MRRWRPGIVFKGTALFMAAAGLATAPLISGVMEHQSVCASHFGDIDAALRAHDVLEAAPAGAVAVGERERDCGDTADHHATVSRSYRLTGLRTSPKDFYEDLAVRNGWPRLSAPGSRCLTKATDGADVSIEVTMDTKSEYTVTASTWPC